MNLCVLKRILNLFMSNTPTRTVVMPMSIRMKTRTIILMIFVSTSSVLPFGSYRRHTSRVPPSLWPYFLAAMNKAPSFIFRLFPKYHTTILDEAQGSSYISSSLLSYLAGCSNNVAVVPKLFNSENYQSCLVMFIVLP